MYFAAALSRDEFVSWIGFAFEPLVRPVDKREILHARRSEIILLWRTPPKLPTKKSAPPLICVDRKDLREFFAFVGTYIGTYQPFSKFFRVVPLDLLALLPEEDLLSSWLPEIPNYLVGAVIAEAKLQAGERVRSVSDLSIQSCLATISNAAASALARGLERRHLEELVHNWTLTRRRLTDENLHVGVEEIFKFWLLIFAAFERVPRGTTSGDGVERRILRFVQGTIVNGEEETGWLELTEGLEFSRSILASMRESREDRVRAFDKALPELLENSNVDRRVREIIAGYLVTRIGGGSMRYIQLLTPLEAKLPLASMWFGLFASLARDNDVMLAGECLGRRLERHIQAAMDPFSPPTADISFTELEAFFPVERSDIKVRTEHAGLLSVEIFPSITASFRLPRETRREPEGKDSSQSVKLLSELRYLTERLERTVRQLSSHDQASLVDDQRGRKTRRKSER